MELYLRRDNQFLFMTHLSQLINLVTGCGGFIIPLILWVTNKDKISGMDEHGKSILNFQISWFLYCLLSIPLILLFGLGLLTLGALGVLAVVLPVYNAIRASNGQSPKYFLSLNFIS
ncbi:MAG: tRNA modification GTPase [Bacteroidetes bacterium MedPE-SWsnd-G2]|nr:MAG: tRNA modification GTPase [Bacteroidetes bacterium MedPE-SWsnd-G2]